MASTPGKCEGKVEGARGERPWGRASFHCCFRRRLSGRDLLRVFELRRSGLTCVSRTSREVQVLRGARRARPREPSALARRLA